MQENREPKIFISLSSIIKPFIFFIIIIELLLVILDILFYYTDLNKLGKIKFIFDITLETGLGSWLSVSQYLLIGLTVFFIFFVAKSIEPKVKNNLGWIIIAMFFIFLSIDDGSAIHERAGGYLRGTSFSEKSAAFSFLDKIKDNFPSYSWFIIFTPVYGMFFLFLVCFLWVKLKNLKLCQYLIVALMYYFVAVGIDFVEGFDGYMSVINFFSLERYGTIHFFRVMEEWAEMLGATFLWFIFCNILPLF